MPCSSGRSYKGYDGSSRSCLVVTDKTVSQSFTLPQLLAHKAKIDKAVAELVSGNGNVAVLTTHRRAVDGSGAVQTTANRYQRRQRVCTAAG